ncbi:hypothetical protein ACWEQL_24895 [Kitasatospora sp. NPDC004240]
MSAGRHLPRGEEEMRALDVPTMLRYGLAFPGPYRSGLFGDGAVAAALAAADLGVLPRSLTFLAGVVRAGGARYAAELAEPLPGGAASRLARDWLTAAATTATTTEADQLLARWLEAVAEILGMRRAARPPG